MVYTQHDSSKKDVSERRKILLEKLQKEILKNLPKDALSSILKEHQNEEIEISCCIKTINDNSYQINFEVCFASVVKKETDFFDNQHEFNSTITVSDSKDCPCGRECKLRFGTGKFDYITIIGNCPQT
ncbi:MAG: hypothetical protein KAF91_02830 [Nostoc sp. TH1S01]|nr:hypothetical protein [Nostoc sp. TH1S01]